MIQKQVTETNRFLRAIWKTGVEERKALLSRTQSFEAAQETLRDYWRLGMATTVIFELETVNSDGKAHRGGITLPAWTEVAQYLEYVFVTVVQEKEEPALRQPSRADVEFAAQTSTSGATFPAGSGTTRQTVARKEEGGGGGSGVLRSPREKRRSNGTLSRRHKGQRRQNTRNNAPRTIPCQQCISHGILCELQTRTAFICLHCKTYGLPCSHKPVDIGKIEHSLRSQQPSSDTERSTSSVSDSEMPGSPNGRGFIQDSASDDKLVSDSEGENEFED